jgi:hypothetical protein
VDRAARRGGYSSVTPHSVEGWRIDEGGQFHARERGVSCYGSELVAVDTCEFMAVVDVLENGPRANLTLLVDASYIMLPERETFMNGSQMVIFPSDFCTVGSWSGAIHGNI